MAEIELQNLKQKFFLLIVKTYFWGLFKFLPTEMAEII